MVFYGVLYLLVVLYISLTYGTYLKFKKNKLKPKGAGKIFVFALPVILTILHFGWAIINLRKDYKFSLFLIKSLIFKYPEIVGIVIEVMLEKLAFKFVQEHSNVKLTQNKKIKKVAEKTNALDLDDVDRGISSQFFKRYKSVILSTA